MNPYDHRVRDWGLYINNTLPMVTGNDIVGTITAFGPSSTSNTPPRNLHPGSLILGQTNYLKTSPSQGGLQQYCILDTLSIAAVPSGITPDAAATVPNNLVAPFFALFGTEGLDLPAPFPESSRYWTTEPGKKQKQWKTDNNFDYANQTLLIVGASGNCGKFGVQCAKLAGFGRIIAVASPVHFEEVRSYGATHVLDRHAADVEKDVRAIVGDELIYALDSVNLDHTLALSCLSNTKPGKLATLVPGQIPAQPSATADKKAGFEDRFSQGASHKQPQLGGAFWDEISGWLERGEVKTLGWDESAEGVIEGLGEEARKRVDRVYDVYRDGGVPGKGGRQVHVHVS